MNATRIDVGGQRPYPVVVGTGVLGELPALLGEAVRTVVVIGPDGLDAIARPVCGVLEAAGYLVHAETVPAGEAAKEIGVAARLWSRLAAHGVTRSDVIVGVGGGATTDLAGFVAATWLRGVRLVLVPTTLLAITDAAVGGKTAINTAEGKNLVGAFYPPAGVLADLAVLESLPARDYASGLAEVIKAGFIADPVILDRRSSLWRGGPTQPSARGLSSGPSDEGRGGHRRPQGRAAGDPQHGHPRPCHRTRGGLPIRHGAVSMGMVRGGTGPPGGRAGRRYAAPAPPGPGRRRAAHHLPGQRLAGPADGDGRGQEGARRGAALCRAGGTGAAGHPRQPPRGPAGTGVCGGDVAVRPVLVLNGPNLGRLGSREPDVYGTVDFDGLAEACRATGRALGLRVEVRQTDDEAELIGWVHEAIDQRLPVVLNPAAFTHYSYALRDALAMRTAPLIEVHISNPAARESFRHNSVVAGVADGTIAGFGLLSYRLALSAIAELGAPARDAG